MKLIWHPLAIADREQIMDFIARDKPVAALELDEAFEIHADRALANPLLYKPGRVAGTREIVVQQRGPSTDHAVADSLGGRIRLSAGMPNFSCSRQIMLSVKGRLRARIS